MCKLFWYWDIFAMRSNTFCDHILGAVMISTFVVELRKGSILCSTLTVQLLLFASKNCRFWTSKSIDSYYESLILTLKAVWIAYFCARLALKKLSHWTETRALFGCLLSQITLCWSFLSVVDSFCAYELSNNSIRYW